MKVQDCSYENSNYRLNSQVKSQNPNFKGVVDLTGGAMQWIQDRGFLASFLIQDGLGMTTPRVIGGFLRDKEVTGKYNTQEGFEVLGREGLTGPIMMAMAPLMLLLAARFGKSTSVNSRLIRRFGDSLKGMLGSMNKDLLKNSDKFKEEFFRKNIREILESTIGEENVKDKHVDDIFKKVMEYINIPKESKGMFKKGRYKDARMEEIVKYFNDLKYNHSSDLDILEKIKFKDQSFLTKDAIDAMVKYCDDIISHNKNLENLNAEQAEKLKNTLIGKRAVTNVATVGATLGVMSLLPKIYARNAIAPGARTAMELEAQEKAELAEKEAENKDAASSEVSFKGGKVNKSLLERIGEFVTKNIKESWASEIEYNGHNFTNTIMTCLSMFGLLLPRGLRAVNRAQKDENGKKDLTELYEILIRDVFSTLSVIFAVPLLTRALVSSYESASGFVLLQKDRSVTGFKRILELLNPYSDPHVLTNKEIRSLYNDIDTKAKMLNFCDYIDKNGGDLQKILSKSEFTEKIFNSKTETFESLAKLSKEESNKKIKDIIKNLGDNANELIKDMMQKGRTNKRNKMAPNKIFSTARGLNSIPAFLMTLVVSPFILGWFIPRLTYANTRRIHEKKAQEKKQAELKAAKVNTAA